MKFILFDENPVALDQVNVIGVDEVGVGDYFGPLVSCAAFIPKDKVELVLKLGIKDSKKLTDKKIVDIYKKLDELVVYATYSLSQKGYNNMSKYNNANELKAFSHLNAINRLLINLKRQKTTIDYIFIDQFSTFKTIEEYFAKYTEEDGFVRIPKIKQPILLAHKAEDKELSVAVASIIARATFLQYMNRQNKTYNIDFPLGASNQVKEFADKLFKDENFKSQKHLICKTSFKMDLKNEEENV